MKTKAILRKKKSSKTDKKAHFSWSLKCCHMKLSKGGTPVVFPKNIKFYIIFIKININVNSNSH
jgi:hypothetical protein